MCLEPFAKASNGRAVPNIRGIRAIRGSLSLPGSQSDDYHRELAFRQSQFTPPRFRMPDLTVKPVETRREQKQFLELPWQINRGDPNWMPPLRRNQQELAGFKPHPFYNEAEAHALIALRGGEPVGRILAIVNAAHNRIHKESRGFFGFFECIDDPGVAAGLFEHARAWLRSKGMTAVRGPVNPSLNYECGLLIEGFDTPPFFMMTHNPPYYQRLIEGCGFQKAEDMFAFWGHIDMIAQLDKKLEFIVQECQSRFDIKLPPTDLGAFLAAGEPVRITRRSTRSAS
jgi:hypothetical protein